MKNYNDLIEQYPEILKHPEGSQEPFALFGFECNIGWYNILEAAFATMVSRYKNCKSTLDYYQRMMDDKPRYFEAQRNYLRNEGLTDEALEDKLNKSFQEAKNDYEQAVLELPIVVQVKEKFGTLRLYIEKGNQTSFAIASYAELMSRCTCEVCGDSGKTYEIGWCKTLCEKHAIERYGEEKVKNHESSD